MVLSVLSLALSAQAATCALTARPFLVGCGALATLNGGASCRLSCLKMYRPTVTSISCPAGGGSVTPSTYVCVPIQQSLFPWRSAIQCTSLSSTGNFPAYTAQGLGTGMAMLATDEWRLTNGGSADRAVHFFGPVRTLGRTTGARSPIEFSFQYKAPSSAGGDGFWGFITNAVPVNPSMYTKPALDPATVFAIELDFFTDSTNTDPSTSHIAILTAASEAHTTTLSNLIANAAPLADGAYHTVNALIQPVLNSGALTITVWHDGTTVARDVLASANVPAALGSLFTARTQVYLGALSYNRASPLTTAGVRSVKALTMCGVERPTIWHRLFVPVGSRVRTCAQVVSFGNPAPANPGVWKPFPCPAGVPARAAPLAPLAVPSA